MPLPTTSHFAESSSTRRCFIEGVQRFEEKLDKIKLALYQKAYLPKNSYQLIAQLLTPTNAYERMLFHELLQACFQLELKCRYSSFLFLKAFLAFAKEYSKYPELTNRKVVEDNHQEEARYWLKLLGTCYPPNPDIMLEVVDQATNNDPVAATAVNEATKLAGLEGNVVVEEWEQPNILVELQFGYNFKLVPFKGFLPLVGTWTKHNPKMLLIDGIVEKVSELDKVLNKSSETKVPLIMIAQGFSEEVVATLFANNKRGTFDIMPMMLEQSLDSLNLLNDIAVVSGCDVINTLKGEMLIYVDYDKLGSVEKASFTEKVLTLHNNKTRNNVLMHLKYLEARRKDQATGTTISDLADLTTKRMQNLLAHLVKVNVPKSEAGRILGNIDNGLRACRTAYTYGFCKPLDIDLGGMTRAWRDAHTAATQLLEKHTSIVGLHIAMKHAANLAGAYFTAAGAVVVD